MVILLDRGEVIPDRNPIHKYRVRLDSGEEGIYLETELEDPNEPAHIRKIRRKIREKSGGQKMFSGTILERIRE